MCVGLHFFCSLALEKEAYLVGLDTLAVGCAPLLSAPGLSSALRGPL